MEGTPEAGIWSTGPVWPLALRSGTGWTVAQHLCVWGELAWQRWWEIEFPAHLGGSCGTAFLARLPEPCRAKNGGTVPTSCCSAGNWLPGGIGVGGRVQKGGQPSPDLPGSAHTVDQPLRVSPLWAWHLSDRSPGSRSRACCLFGQVIYLPGPCLPHL